MIGAGAEIIVLQDKIIRILILGDWRQTIITEYHFNENKLTKLVNIMSPGNADKMFEWIVGIQREQIGNPNVIQAYGNSLYCWDKEDENICYFKDYSQRLRNECLFIVRTPLQ